MDEVRVSKFFFNNLSKKSISGFMGEVLKLIEVIDNKEDLKRTVKEKCYEYQRHIWDKLEAFAEGSQIEVKIVDRHE